MTKELTPADRADLEIALTTCNANIAKATRLGLRWMAQDMRRERRRIRERLGL